jgi:tRNA-dihydrouridine synthase
MIGRAAIDDPWIFGAARALLERGARVAPPDPAARIALYRELLAANAAARGEKFGVEVTRRHLGLLGPLGAVLRRPLCAATTLAGAFAVLDGAAAEAPPPRAPGQAGSSPAAPC